MKFITASIIIILNIMITAQTNYSFINNEIQNGNFTKATELINNLINSGELNEVEIYDLKFQIERMERIRKDFRRSYDDVVEAIKKYFPEVNVKMIDEWENNNSLEFMIIDGEKKYFNNAVPNLFRVNKKAKERKIEVDGIQTSNLLEFLKKDLPGVVGDLSDNKILTKPKKIKYKYTLSVKPNVVPEGEIIRAWLPYPREGNPRQNNIKLINSNVEEYIIAGNEHLQRSIYMEKKSKAEETTVFQIEVEYSASTEWHNVNPEKVKEYNINSEEYKYYTAERFPHIVFSEKIKKLSEEIIGNETNPFNKVLKIYEWIHINIPWASAREYSTHENISEYCIDKMYGDCGIKTLLFMTLARYNGIPARWQSGWMFHPGSVNLHDWCQIYLEGYGWIPLDQDFGLQDSENEKVKYFFTNGVDTYHFIVNDDYSTPLYPAKIFPRSETVDFQRGEVEWKGGNLYFDKWNYKMEVDYEE